MKKIMIMLGAIAFAFGVQAASVDWAVNYAGQGATWAANGATVMAFAGSDYDAIVALVTVSGSETLAADLADYAIGSTSFKNNRGAATGSASTTDAPDSMFWMVLADGSTDAGSSVLWTAATDVKANQYTPPASGTQFAMTAANFTNSGTIAATAVPEPTSGLLMLVGLAGLALRRRRA